MSNERRKILQIGVGSMGSRRLRDLSRRSDVDLTVLDGGEDRRIRAVESFPCPRSLSKNHVAALIGGGEGVQMPKTRPFHALTGAATCSVPDSWTES